MVAPRHQHLWTRRQRQLAANVAPSPGWGWLGGGQSRYLPVEGPGQLLTLQGQLVAQTHHQGRALGHPHLDGPHLGDPGVGEDGSCGAGGGGSASTGVPPGHPPGSLPASPGGSAAIRWLRLMAKPRSGMVRRETRTCRPLSAGKQSNCTCHCGERGHEWDVQPRCPAPRCAPDSPVSCPAPGAAATPAASQHGWNPAPGS